MNETVTIPKFGQFGLETKTEERLIAVLHNVHPLHVDRLWLAGYLLNRYGRDVYRVCDIIDHHNQWEDYKPNVTFAQVRSVLRSMGRSGTGFHVPRVSYDDWLEIAETLKRRKDERP